MKVLFSFLFALTISFVAYPQDMIISGVGERYDGRTLAIIELYVLNDINSDTYVVKAYRPDNSLIGQTTIYPPLSAGTHLYLANDDYYFEPFFGFFPTTGFEYSAAASLTGGDDTVYLELNSSIVDIYGVLGVDGLGTAWEYSRGWVYRKDGFGPNTTFTLSEWNIMDDAFIGCSPNSECTDPYPSGSYTLSVDSKESREFRVFPNPNKGILHINGNLSQLKSISIYSFAGQHIMELQDNFKEIDLSSLKSAIYFLRLDTDEKTGIFKIVKE